MKKMFQLVLAIALIIIPNLVIAGELFKIDFENPPYVGGELIGQEDWISYDTAGNYMSGNNITNSLAYSGNQSAVLFSKNEADSYSIAKTQFEELVVDISNNYVVISAAIWPTTTRDDLSIYAPDYASGYTIRVGDTVDFGSKSITAGFRQWNTVEVTMDLLNSKLVSFGVNGATKAINENGIPAIGAIRLLSQINSLADANFPASSYFDDISFRTTPSFHVATTPELMSFTPNSEDLFDDQTLELSAQIAGQTFECVIVASEDWLILDITNATITSTPTFINVGIDGSKVTLPAVGNITVIGLDGSQKNISVNLRNDSIAYEDFAYDLGEGIADADGGQGFSSAWSVDGGGLFEIVEGLSYTGLETSGNSLNCQMTNGNLYISRNTTTPFSNNEDVWISYLLKVDKLEYNSVFLRPSENWDSAIGKQNGQDVFCIHNVPSDYPVEQDQTYLLVAKYDANGASLWVNPKPNGKDPGTPTVTSTSAAFTSGENHDFFFHMSGGEYTIDEIHFGFTFEEVAPPIIENVEATQGDFGDKVVITWDLRDDVDSYEIYRASVDDPEQASAISGDLVDLGEYEDTTVVPGDVYYYWVYATFDSGDKAFSCSTEGYASGDIPFAPDNLTATQGTQSNAIALAWDPTVKATKYSVFRGSTPDFSFATLVDDTIDTNLFVDTTVDIGAGYIYWVKAGSDEGWSSESDSAFGYTISQESFICYENFDYPIGSSFPGAAGGIGFDSPWEVENTGFMEIVDGLTYPKLKTSGNSFRCQAEGTRSDLFRGTSTAYSADDTVWVSFLLRADVIGSGSVFLKPAENWDSAIGKQAGAVFSIHNELSDVIVNTDEIYLLVAKYDASGVALWLNPSLDNEPTSGSAIAKSPYVLTSSDIIRYHIARNAADINQYTIDEMRFGYSFEDVTPNYVVKNVQASDGTYTDKVAITWDLRSDATSYVVYRNTTDDSSTAMAVSGELTIASFDDTTAVAGEVYFYWIYATFADGQQAFSYSDAGYRSADGAPDVPANISASDAVPNQKYVVITYDASVGATVYRVYRSTEDDYSTAINVSGDIMGTIYHDSTVTVGIKYYYWVRAQNANGWSDFSASDSGSIPAILIAYYALNELDSTNMVDSSENKFDGIYRDDPILGVASADAALFETAVQFDVSDATINSNTPIRDLTNNFTVAMWVNPDELGTDEYRYLMGVNSEVGGWSVQTYNNEVLIEATGLGNAWTGEALVIDTWTHVAFTYNVNNTIRVFVDGMALGSTTRIGSPANYDKCLTYIANGGEDQLFFGSLDEIRVYSGVVTDAEIAELAGVPEPAIFSLLFALIGMFIYRRK